MTTNEVLRVFETKAEVARALDISPSAVSRWGIIPPLLRQYQLQVVTAGRLTAEKARDQ